MEEAEEEDKEKRSILRKRRRNVDIENRRDILLSSGDPGIRVSGALGV